MMSLWCPIAGPNSAKNTNVYYSFTVRFVRMKDRKAVLSVDHKNRSNLKSGLKYSFENQSVKVTDDSLSLHH